MRSISIRVVGEPKPQARPRTFLQGGRIVTWSPKSDWTNAVYAAALSTKSRPSPPLDKPLAINLTFWLPRPKCRAGEVYSSSRGDWDNYAKGTCDALTRAKWWTDDCRIVKAFVEKRYESEDEQPGVKIDVEEI